MLEAARDDAPATDEPFVVVDASLIVCSLSMSAERLLRTSESCTIHRSASSLFVLADSESGSFAGRLADAVRAALDRGETSTFHVRPPVGGADGETEMRMRVGICGTPPAALLVVSPIAS